ncbi:MAG: bifunctional diguanylate cyclase/phosphodiesterase [Aliarcobacter sp.]|nr:bifunctional diguanylate cyclase/phosphodiesterase [Aliarcobacter sp.]
MINKFDFRLFTIICSFFVVLYLSFDFKSRLDRFNNNYYDMTQNINELRLNWHQHLNILKQSIIFLRFSNDNIVEHLKHTNLHIKDLDNKKELKDNFPIVYKDFSQFENEYTLVTENTYSFLMINAKIKNSLFILERNLRDLGKYEKIYGEKYIQILTRFMSAKNNFNEDNNISKEIYEYFENTKSIDPMYELNFVHIKVLYEELPKFKILFNTIEHSKLDDIIDEMFIDLDKESNKLKASMQNLFLIILTAYIFFFLLIVYYSIKIKNDTYKIVDLEKQKQKTLRTDKLTGLLNRNAFYEDSKSINDFSVILIDITDFSDINSIAGYKGGDYILNSLCEIFKRVKKFDINKKKIYRVNADCFAIVVETKDKFYLNSMALEIITQIENSLFIYEELELPVYIQAGISQEEPFLRNAELAILQTKNSFDKVSFYTSELNNKKHSIENINMLKKVKEALKNNKIRPFFQPLVDLKTKNIVKYEALVRLIDDEGKAIAPFFFLELTKKSKLYPKITKLVIEKSIEFIKKENLGVSINISYQDIKDKSTLYFISSILEINRDISHFITFELLESEQIENYDEVFKFIDLIKSYGCKLAIDDFGSGYSNFTHIFNMNPDILKLDGSLIKDITTNKNSENIVKAMIMLAKESGIQTVAEFVDSLEVDEYITKLGIDFGQGYFYSPAKDIL